MNQVEVIAICGFEHNGRRMPGDRFRVSELHAKALKDRGLVSLPDDGEQKGTTAPASTANAVTDKGTARAARGKSGGAAEKSSADPKTPAGNAGAAADPVLADGQQPMTNDKQADQSAGAASSSGTDPAKE